MKPSSDRREVIWNAMGWLIGIAAIVAVILAVIAIVSPEGHL